jgi:hypothetical protein
MGAWDGSTLVCVTGTYFARHPSQISFEVIVGGVSPGVATKCFQQQRHNHFVSDRTVASPIISSNQSA